MQLSTISLALTRLGGGAFSPASLFAGGTVAGAWYDPSDLSTLFTTSAGTTQCAMPGLGSAVSVGLMLDKSQNGVGTNGAARYNVLPYSENLGTGSAPGEWLGFNLTRTNNFSGVLAPNGTQTAARLLETTTNGLHSIYLSDGTNVSAASYVCSFYVRGFGRDWCYVNLYNGNNATDASANVYFDITNGQIGNVGSGATASIVDAGNGWWRCVVTRTLAAGSGSVAGAYAIVGPALANGTNSYAGDVTKGIYAWGADLRLASEANTQPTYQRIDANWYSTMAGNHAIAFNDTTARPELRARVNLLEYSEQFDNASWSKTNTTITPNAVAAPNSTITADSFVESTDAVASQHNVNRAFSVTNGVSYTFSVCAKYENRAWVVLTGNRPGWHAYFDIQNGVTGNRGSLTTASSIENLGNGWYRCSVTVTADSTIGVAFQIYAATANGTSREPTYVGTGAVAFYLWGADLRPANIGANVPAYQRIADANTYDTSGFPLYLRFDGIDDSMYTPANLNLSGTDKVSVFAGVRKNDNTNAQAITELSAAANTNNGAFWVFTNLTAGGGASSAAYALATNGTAFAGTAATGTTAPITNVLSGALKISTSSDNTVLRVNGAQVATSGATSSGTGNFGTYPLYIGARNNNSVWLNGQIYSLIIAGSAVSAGNISATEQWVAQKTGLVIP